MSQDSIGALSESIHLETIIAEKLYKMKSGFLTNFMVAFDGPDITLEGQKVMTLNQIALVCVNIFARSCTGIWT